MKLKDAKILFSFPVFILSFCVLSLFWQFGKAFNNKEKSWNHVPLPKVKPAWENKVDVGKILKVGIMTDNHIRPTRINNQDERENSPRVIKPDDLVVFERFNKKMKIFNPDFIVHLGDGIEGTDDPDFVGLSGLSLIKKELLKNNRKIYWVLGNHELRSVSKDQFRGIVGLENLNYTVDMGDYRFVFLDGNYNPKNIEDDFEGYGYIPGFIHPKNLVWLEDQLMTNKRVFVFMHQSILNQEYLSSDQLAKSPIFNAREVMDLFERYNVEAFFNGHIESFYYREVEGVKYYSLPGPKKNLDYQKSYYELTIENDKTNVEMFYQDNRSGRVVRMDFENGQKFKE